MFATTFTVLTALLCAAQLPGVLRDVKVVGQTAEMATTDTGVTVNNAAPITATVAAAPDAFLCRLRPGPDTDVVQLSIGLVESLRCNALFSPSRDEAIELDGTDVRLTWTDNAWHLAATGPLTVTVTPDFMKTQRGLKWFKPLDRTHFKRAPSGWCSWYVYWQGVTEDEMVKNAQWLHDNLLKFGCDICQLDDGWQGVGHGSGMNRDWNTIAQDKFPHGMKWLADQIRAQGLMPGIWLIPFTQSDTQFYQQNLDLFVRDAQGRSVGERQTPLDYTWMSAEDRQVEWIGRYVIDPTGKQGQDYLTGLFERICDRWGYDYVKIDGQGGMANIYGGNRERLANPQLAGDEAYRAGLDAIKAVMGPDRFLLNCGGQYDSCGYCEGIRTGGDVGPSWEGMQPAIGATMARLYLNNIAFYTDPDVVCVRPEGNAGSRLSMDQAKVWATLYGITGQLLMASDRMYDLPEESVELLRRIYPVADIRPMELYPLAGRPRFFDLRVNSPGAGQWDVVAAFNWTPRDSAGLTLDPQELGLPAGGYVYYDVWGKHLLGAGNEPLPLWLAPTSCRVVAVRPMTDYPQLVGASRHLTQGADDLLAASWDMATGTWSGRSRVVAGDPYELRFTLPPGWTCTDRAATVEGPLAVLTLRSATSADVAWKLAFQHGDAAPPAPAVREAKVTLDGRQVAVTWEGDGALGYRVYRNGELVDQVGETHYHDLLRPGRQAAYEVAAVGWAAASAKVSAGEASVPPLPRRTADDVWLQDLDPVSATQEWGTLHRGHSVENHPVRIGGQTYDHGLGTHARSEVLYALDNHYARFTAQVGVDDEKEGGGTVEFVVFADGEQVYDSGVMKGGDAAKPVDVALDGVAELLLVVNDGGDGINSDHADWAEARLIGNR